MGEDERGIESQEPGGKAPKSRRTRVMLIGIDKYAHWPQLGYPVRDCLGFFEVLRKHYGFTEADLVPDDRKQLLDEEATADSIFDELYRLADKDEYGNPHLGPKDNLIVYFSGHGHLDKTLNEGYWVPVEAPLPNRGSDLRKLISVGEVVKALSSIDAHHIVLIVDACFPQAFTRMDVEVIAGGDPNNPEEKPSRWALTSGRLEAVPDKSLFAESLRDLLENNDNLKLSVITLGADVMKRVRNKGLQNAWSASLTENRFDGGEFFFYRQTPAPVTECLPQQIITTNTLRLRMREGSQKYLERLKSGRFRHLRIESLLLTETKLPKLVSVEVKVLEEQTPLQNAVSSLWGKERPHAVVLGEGGMGKTVSLLHLWEDQLNSGASTIPVFVALNEYNALPENEQHDFVLRSIARYCGLAEVLTDDWRNALWDILRQPQSDGTPSLLLLLDGFNEVTAERTPLLVELNRIARDTRGVQMAITSRYVEIRNFQWAQESEIVELQPLPEVVVSDYLQTLGIDPPTDHALWQLLGNPMMLTIFAGSSQIAHAYGTDPRFRFLPARSVGELLWNFTEALLVKSYEDHAHDPGEQAWHRFLIRCLLPYIAYRMEANGDFFLSYGRRDNPQFNYKSLLEETFVVLDHPDLTEVFPEFEGRRGQLGLGEAPNLDAAERSARRVREYLLEKLHLMVLEKESLRFLHQNFRDFFAACHLLNLVDFGSPAPAWTSRVLPVYLRRMLGQIEGEHHYDLVLAFRSAPMPGFQLVNRLSRLLDRYRGTFHDEAAQTAVLNLVKTLADTRNTLAGANLRYLDLQKVVLNNIPLSKQCGGYQYLPAQMRGALVKGRMLLPNGHSGNVNSICYSPDGKKILSGSGDQTIKEWSVTNGECLRTFEGHLGIVTSVCYSPDGEKVLSGSYDKTVKEWSVKTGKCLQSLQGHLGGVSSICYSPDGEKVLSGSYDKTVREWFVKTGKCLQSFQGHLGNVSSVCYSPDSEKVLSGSDDKTVKEWSIKTGKCLQTILGHSSGITSVCYSGNGDRILSGSRDKTIKEWLLLSGECLQTILGHLDWVNLVSYSPDGKKVLSGALDGMIKEWSVESGECLHTFIGNWLGVYNVCYGADGKKVLSGAHDGTVKEWLAGSGRCLQTFSGHLKGVNSACYSPDGKKVLSGSDDKTIREWSVESGECLQNYIGHSRRVNSACYSPDGKKVLSGSDDRTIKEWSVESGECLQNYIGHSGGINSVCYSHEGKKILSGSVGGLKFNKKNIREWSVERRQCLQTFVGHFDSINSIYYCPHGKKILSGSDDKTIREWSVESGKCLQIFFGHRNRIRSVCYYADGNKLLSGSLDNTLKEWSAETGKCIQTFHNEFGLILQSCDFTNLHPDSTFTEDEKERLRQHGAIFDEKDRQVLEEALVEARKTLQENQAPNTSKSTS